MSNIFVNIQNPRVIADANRRQPKQVWFIVVGLIGLAFALRIYTVGWGLPYVDHPDEPSAANKALAMIRRGDWDPRFFEKPSLYYYLLRMVLAAHLKYGFATGLYTDMAQIPVTTDHYITTPQLFIWGRMISVVLGALTVLVIYIIGRRWWGWHVGLAAAALLAVSSFHMRESQYITVDVTTTLMALLGLGAALRLVQHSQWRDYTLAGFVAGLAASAKYNAGAVLFSVMVAHGLVWGRASLRQSGRLAWAGLCGLLGFLIATPYAALTFNSFMTGLLRQTNAYTYGPPGVNQRWPVFGYLKFLWRDGLHPTPFLAMLVGIALVLWRRDRYGLILLAFVPTQLLFFLAQNRHFERNLLPIIPPLLIYAAIGIDGLAMALGRVMRARTSQFVWAGRLVMPALLLAIMGEPLIDAIQFTRFEALPDSRVRAGEYVRTSLSRGAPIAVALNPVQWAGQGYVTALGDVTAHDVAWYRAQGYRYLIANVKDADPQRYEALHAQAQVIQVFPGDQDGQPGPRMEALDLGMQPSALAIERRDTLFGGELQLLGFQQGTGDLRAAFTPLKDDVAVKKKPALLLNMYWQPLTLLEYDYTLFLHLVAPDGRIVAQRDALMRAADYPSAAWQPNELVLDMADLPLPADLPPGSYQLMCGVYRADTFQRLGVPGTSNNELPLLTITIP